MSLLDRGPGYEDVTVYPEETWTSPDGNLMTRASTTGVPARAVIQVAAASGTSSRRSEQDNEGFESEENYRVRFQRGFPLVLGAQSQLEWRGVRWALVGDPRRYSGSPRTGHYDYTIRRT